jgi:hypothetical protein
MWNTYKDKERKRGPSNVFLISRKTEELVTTNTESKGKVES